MEGTMKRFNLIAALIVVPLIFFGCATPKVRYRAEDDVNKNYIPFALLASRATITLPTVPEQAKDKDGGTVEKTVAALSIEKPQPFKVEELAKTKIIVTPTQAQQTLRYLEPYDCLLSRTNISITYFDAMKVPKSVGVTVEDNTIKLISALGTFVGALGTVLAAPIPPGVEKPKEISLPIVLDFSNPEDFKTYGQEQCKPIGEPNKKYHYCFTLTEKESRKTTRKMIDGKKEMYTYETFFMDYEKKFTRHIPFSRCVDLKVTIKEWDESEKRFKPPLSTYYTYIADPYHVDWLSLPQKGSITLQGVCDANSTSEKSDNAEIFGVIEAVGKQVDSVWKAWHPKSQ